ncbi:hypothetical protein [Methanobrevibacter sp. DSM 116169]|uniref:hypothetical protein n=1 Tax=Methanobrevibacter sp. DSM 116169 TaxID=3242727 RepID=UPI0038FC92C3
MKNYDFGLFEIDINENSFITSEYEAYYVDEGKPSEHQLFLDYEYFDKNNVWGLFKCLCIIKNNSALNAVDRFIYSKDNDEYETIFYKNHIIIKDNSPISYDLEPDYIYQYEDENIFIHITMNTLEYLKMIIDSLKIRKYIDYSLIIPNVQPTEISEV